MTKILRDWKNFLASDKNKQSLTIFLLNEWKKDKYARMLVGRKVYFVCADMCTCLTTTDGQYIIPEDTDDLRSNQEEADTKIVLHCLHIAVHSSSDSTITVRSPDTDVFILLLKYAQNITQTVLFDTGVGNKRRLINIQSVIKDVGKALCCILPAVHAFSGCDTTSSFVRKGKIAVIKILRQHSEFFDTFA